MIKEYTNQLYDTLRAQIQSEIERVGKQLPAEVTEYIWKEVVYKGRTAPPQDTQQLLTRFNPIVEKDVCSDLNIAFDEQYQSCFK